MRDQPVLVDPGRVALPGTKVAALASRRAPARPHGSRRRTLGTVAGHVINGDRWIAERLAYLRAHLERDLADDVRRTVEDEIVVLSKERGMIAGGFRVPRLLR